MSKAQDTRFAGTDERLLALAEALGLPLDALDARTLPNALAETIEEHGIPVIDEARSLMAYLIRADGDARAARPGPQPLTRPEATKRRRLARLALGLAEWRARAGPVLIVPATGDEGERTEQLEARPAYRGGGHNMRGLAAVLREVAAREGAQWLAFKRWCVTDPHAQALIASMRPLKPYSGPTKPRRGLGRTSPTGDAGSALQDIWK